MEVLVMLPSEVGKYTLVGCFFGLLIHLSMLSPKGQGNARGMDFINITSQMVGILKFGVGEFLIFFTYFYII